MKTIKTKAIDGEFFQHSMGRSKRFGVLLPKGLKDEVNEMIKAGPVILRVRKK